jgi:hypothetical protein
MPNPVDTLALAEALATASTTTAPFPCYKNSRFLSPNLIDILRAGVTGGGTVWGAYLPGLSSSPTVYSPALGDGVATTYDTTIPFVALANNNLLVRATRSTRTGTVTTTVGSTAVTGSGTAFLTELRIGDEISIGGEIRNVVAAASATALTVDRPFATASTAVAYQLIDSLLIPTTDYTVSNVGGFCRFTFGAAAKAPSGARLEFMLITPVNLFTFVTATLTFKQLEVQGVDTAWYASDATASPSATNVYLRDIA